MPGTRGLTRLPLAAQVSQARDVAKAEHTKAQSAMARLSENGAPHACQPPCLALQLQQVLRGQA